jgi:glyoxylase-like metal-dependent hydrolase (beta-lactamase superfamily II)
LLLRGNDRCILVETGIGDKFDDKRAGIFNVRPAAGGLRAQLSARGIAPEDVTDVILTHLHFDHCGGTTHRVDGELALSFPGAVHHLQRRQWEWAQHPSDKDGGSFREEDFALLADARLRLLDGDGEVLDGIDVRVVDGHTPAMQMVSVVAGDGVGLLFCADLVPTKAHLRWPYIMAYDNQPMVTLEEKHRWLPRAAAAGEIVVFGHDPTCDGAKLRMENGSVAVEREVTL